MATTIGTCYFVSRASAYAYYRHQDIDRAGVDQKLAEGEIYIGIPHTKADEKLVRLPDGRFGLQVEDK